MLIRSTHVLFFAVLAIAAGRSGAVQAQQYTIDPAHTAVAFQISHLGLSWTHGRFNETSGDFVIDPSGDRSEFILVVNAASIDTGNQKRDDHLRSPDFFNVKQFPAITFKSTRVTPVDGGYDVTGELTMHGQRRPVSLRLQGGRTAEFPDGVMRTGFTTRLKLKRSDFGMTNMLEAVGDEVFIDISFEGTKK